MGMVFLACAALLLVAIRCLFPREPSYQGKRLSEWARILGSTEPTYGDTHPVPMERQSLRTEAIQAIRSIGTNATPIALRYCRAKESATQRKILDWLKGEECPHGKDLISLRFTRDHDYRYVAIYTFKALGSDAKAAAPELIRLFQDDDLDIQRAAAVSLYMIGPETIPLLLETLANTNECSRINALGTLGAFTTNATHALPAVLSCLEDNRRSVRVQVARTLPYLVGPTNEIISKLLGCLKHGEPELRDAAALSLGQIGREPERVVPELLAQIGTATNAQGNAYHLIKALEEFGTNARPWSPILIQMIEADSVGHDPRGALRALEKLDAAAAAPLIARERSNSLWRGRGGYGLAPHPTKTKRPPSSSQ